MLNSWIDALGFILAFTVLFAFPIWFTLYVFYQIYLRLSHGKSQLELSLDEFNDEPERTAREREADRKKAA